LKNIRSMDTHNYYNGSSTFKDNRSFPVPPHGVVTFQLSRSSSGVFSSKERRQGRNRGKLPSKLFDKSVHPSTVSLIQLADVCLSRTAVIYFSHLFCN
jgi:hypothetical protein